MVLWLSRARPLAENSKWIVIKTPRTPIYRLFHTYSGELKMLCYLEIIKEQDPNMFPKYHSMLRTPQVRHSHSCYNQTTVVGDLHTLRSSAADFLQLLLLQENLSKLPWPRLGLGGREFPVSGQDNTPWHTQPFPLTQLSKQQTAFINTGSRKSAVVFK